MQSEQNEHFEYVVKYARDIHDKLNEIIVSQKGRVHFRPTDKFPLGPDPREAELVDKMIGVIQYLRKDEEYYFHVGIRQ